MIQCKACGTEIVWLKTSNGKNMPVDAETVTEGDTVFESKSGHVSHFATCDKADQFRKKGKE